MYKLATILAFGMSAAAAAAQAPAWRVSEVSGDVRIVENGRSRAVTRGALLSSGSTIATAARARAVLVRGQEYVVVSPSSRLRVPDQQQGRGGVIQMLTDWGTALFRIERRATPHFGVQTPYLAAVVKGTVFTVTVGDAGASVQVTEGAVEVSTLDAGAAELVTPGEVVNVSAADLQQLNVEGETTRAIRSDGTPLPGVVTVPAPQAGLYEGPAAAAIEVTALISEGAVSLSQTTRGLIDGNVGYDLALANVADQARLPVSPAALEPDAAPPVESAPLPDSAASGQDGGSSGGNESSAGGEGSADDPADNAPPGGADSSGDGAGGASGGDSDIGSPGASPGDAGDDDAAPEDDGNNGNGNDQDGDDDSNPGQGSGRTDDDDGGNQGSGGDGGDDGNNGHGNDDDGDDDSNPGRGGDRDDDGNNGHGNDEDGDDDSNPGRGGGGRGGGIEICLPGDLLCIGLGGGDNDDDDRGRGRGRGRGRDD